MSQIVHCLNNNIICQSTLKSIYYAYIHSILSYGIIFWGNSAKVNKLFILQKKIVRNLANIGTRESCREAFKNMEIMTLCSQYIYSLILSTVDNKHLFTPNNEIHKYATRNNVNLHLPTVNVSKFYKGPHTAGTRAFNHLPRYLKLLVNDGNVLKYLLRDFYITILFTQLRNITSTARTKTCKSFYMGSELNYIMLYYLTNNI